ncbi:hypothetical protein EV426DRAFT_711232 [Tirmania nivea]|nr:hypothetical protein EV426DRAFT_711232 [Tirmania nivea]
MGDCLPTSSKSTDRGSKGASRIPWHPHPLGTLAFDNWSYPPDTRPESSSQPPSHSNTCYRQLVSVGYGPQPAVGHEGQATAFQRPVDTRMSTPRQTQRGPPPQTLLAFRERPTLGNVNQHLGKDGCRRNESPTTFLSRILSEPRPSPTERRQISVKERHSDRDIERAEMNARLASSRWERGGDFTSQPGRTSKSALANVPARASALAATRYHGPAHMPNTCGQMSSKPSKDHSSDSYIHPARREIIIPAPSGGRYSADDLVSELETVETPPGSQPATITNMLPVQFRKLLPIPRPRPQSTTYPIPTYPKPAPVQDAKPLHCSNSRIPAKGCGTKRARVHPEPPPPKRSKTLEDIKRIEEENKRLQLENKSIEIQIQIAKAERLRQEAVKKAAQELQLRALELKNAKLKQDNIELKLQLERSTQSSDVRECSAGRSVAKALAEDLTAARLLSDVTKTEGQIKPHLGIRAASNSPWPIQALEGAKLTLERMEVETQSGEKNNTAMIKAGNPIRAKGKGSEGIEPGKPVKVEVDKMTEAPFTLDYKGTQDVDIKMEEF